MKKLSINRFSEEVLDIMPLMFREFARRENNALAQGKISCPQMVALHLADERGEITVGEIASSLSSEKSSVSVLLDRLVQQKMMRRRHDQHDRRVVWMSLTPKGRKVIDQIMAQKKESLKAIFGSVSASERAQYLNVLRKVRSSLVKSAALFLLFTMPFGATQAEAWPWQKKKPIPATVVDVKPTANLLTLQDAYTKALKRSESVKITAEELAQAQARFYRSFDYFLPRVHYKITRFEQDVRSGSSGSAFDFSRGEQREQRFTFSQPIFSGFREIAALTGTGADKKAQRMKLERARQVLFIDVMEAYYNYLNAQKDTEVLDHIHQLMSDRLNDLTARVDVGRSRDGELKNSTADMKILEADRVASKKLSRTAQNLLEFYIGEPLDGYQLSQENQEPTDWIPDLTRSELRPDVVEAEQNYIVSQKKVISAHANFYPEVYVDGNYYTRREGFQSGNDWDVLVTVDVPVLEIGTTLGDIKESSSNREKARLTWEQKKRMSFAEAENALEEYNATQEMHLAMRGAQQASKENYEILQKEFGQNLVNNLEVLDSLRRYQDVQRRYNVAFYEAKKSYWRLCASLGDIPGTQDPKGKK